jgi:hypothetical protein
MFGTVTKAKLATCFNFQEQKFQSQPISLALANIGGEMCYFHVTAKKYVWLLVRAKDQYQILCRINL